MSLHLYDTATRAKTEFRPLHEGKVSIYACGPTVQSAPHLGHIRKEVNFDVLRRWLEASGYEVTFVANITDIDDKILIKSAEAGHPWWAHAYHYEGVFHDAYRALGIKAPTYEPRATGHIPEMIDLIATLIERGHAYVAGPGDVYFDVRSWPAYGELSGMKVDELASEEEQAAGKRDPRDFALWKANKPGEQPVVRRQLAGRRQRRRHVRLQDAVAGDHAAPFGIDARPVGRMRGDRDQLAQPARRQLGVAVQRQHAADAVGQARGFAQVDEGAALSSAPRSRSAPSSLSRRRAS